MPLNAIFFDAGNTLVFPDLSKTLAALHAIDIRPSDEQLWAAERAARKRRDASAAEGARLGDRDYWDIYYSQLLLEIGGKRLPADARFFDDLKARLIAASQNSQNWEHLRPHTRDVLLDLKRRFKLAVISNSDGRMEKLIERVGVRDCFDAVIDSGTVGYEKPDPRIFHAAVEQAGESPANCLYVGDVYSIDYLGATRAGLQAILFDVSGAYRDSDFPRVESLDQLRDQLAAAA